MTETALKSRDFGWYHRLLQAGASHLWNSLECFLIFHLAQPGERAWPGVYYFSLADLISNSFTNHKWALRLHLVPTVSFLSITFPPSWLLSWNLSYPCSELMALFPISLRKRTSLSSHHRTCPLAHAFAPRSLLFPWVPVQTPSKADSLPHSLLSSRTSILFFFLSYILLLY